MSICIYTYMYIYTYTYIYTHTCIYSYIYAGILNQNKNTKLNKDAGIIKPSQVRLYHRDKVRDLKVNGKTRRFGIYMWMRGGRGGSVEGSLSLSPSLCLSLSLLPSLSPSHVYALA